MLLQHTDASVPPGSAGAGGAGDGGDGVRSPSPESLSLGVKEDDLSHSPLPSSGVLQSLTSLFGLR
jgi:hypothetical protein